MSNAPPFLYDIAIEGLGFQRVIEWGVGIPWKTKYADQLLRMGRISLIPKKDVGKHLSVVTTTLGDDKKWILFSRVFSSTSQVSKIRLYAIGWEKNVGGVTIKSINWIYPNGAVENALMPSYHREFMALAKKIERGEGLN